MDLITTIDLYSVCYKRISPEGDELAIREGDGYFNSSRNNHLLIPANKLLNECSDKFKAYGLFAVKRIKKNVDEETSWELGIGAPRCYLDSIGRQTVSALLMWNRIMIGGPPCSWLLLSLLTFWLDEWLKESGLFRRCAKNYIVERNGLPLEDFLSLPMKRYQNVAIAQNPPEKQKEFAMRYAEQLYKAYQLAENHDPITRGRIIIDNYQQVVNFQELLLMLIIQYLLAKNNESNKGLTWIWEKPIQSDRNYSEKNFLLSYFNFNPNREAPIVIEIDRKQSPLIVKGMAEKWEEPNQDFFSDLEKKIK